MQHGEPLFLFRHQRLAAIGRLWNRVSTVDPDETFCPICRVDYFEASDEVAAEIPIRQLCGHVFGNACCQEWLEEHDTCPTCRRDYAEHLNSLRNERPISNAEHPYILQDFTEAVARSVVAHCRSEATVRAEIEAETAELVFHLEREREDNAGIASAYVADALNEFRARADAENAQLRQ